MALFTAIGTALGATIAASATGIGAFGVGVAATALAGSAVGASLYSSKLKGKAAKKSAEASQERFGALATPSTETAAAQAKSDLLFKRKSIARSKSIFTDPLGLQTGANIVRKNLLGQ